MDKTLHSHCKFSEATTNFETSLATTQVLPPPVPAEVADTGRIRFGAGVRLPALRPDA